MLSLLHAHVQRRWERWLCMLFSASCRSAQWTSQLRVAQCRAGSSGSGASLTGFVFLPGLVPVSEAASRSYLILRSLLSQWERKRKEKREKGKKESRIYQNELLFRFKIIIYVIYMYIFLLEPRVQYLLIHYLQWLHRLELLWIRKTNCISHKKELIICYNVDETWKYYAQ